MLTRKQKSKLNLVLSVLILAAGVWSVLSLDRKEPAKPAELTDEEIALHMQCDDRHGTMAMARGPQGEWVACYQGRKKLWSVKIKSSEHAVF